MTLFATRTATLSIAVATQLFLGSIAAHAAACGELWNRAEQVIAYQCNERIRNNSMCFAHAPLSTQPEFADFRNEGDRRPIEETLRSINAQAGGAIGGFSFLKVISGRRMDELPIGHAIMLIAFGDTSLLQIVSRAPPIDIDAGDICSATLRPASTTYQGSYIRALPDPQFEYACVDRSPYCEDKSNLLFFVNEGEELQVKGRNGSGTAILVHNQYATGWMTASPQYVQLHGCNLWDLPTFRDNIIVESTSYPVDLPIVSEFRLINRTTSQSERCLSENRPPGGLLILNPGHQTIVFSVNSIELELSSSIFLTHHGSITKAFVLQGAVRVTSPNGRTVPARSGDVVEIIEQGMPTIVDRRSGPRVGWCDALAELARAAYRNSRSRYGTLRVPDQRIDYCSFAAGSGYPLGTIVYDSFRRLDDLGLPPRTSTQPAPQTAPPAPPAGPRGGIINQIPF